MAFDFGGLASVGVNAASGNYIGAAISAVGLGMSLFGGMEQSDIAKQQAAVAKQQSAVSGDIATQEQGINDVKQRQMEIEGRRMQLETLRNMQRGRAQAIAAATNQGAQFGSGLQGGEGQVEGNGLFNQLGVSYALQGGRDINTFNQSITGDKLKLASLGGQMSDLQGQSASAQGMQSLGGSIMKAGPVFGQFSSGFGGSRSSGNYSGTPGASNTGGLY